VIVDGFIFYNEVDILEIRLEELYPVVDKFVLIDSYQTFQGNANPGYFKVGHPRWEKYADKIIHVSTSFAGVADDPWAREAHQRNMISYYAKATFAPDDILIVSDADEVPRRSAVKSLDTLDTPAHLTVRTYCYALNVRAGYDQAIKAARVRDVDNAQDLRKLDPINTKEIENGGWHFSSLGDAEFISNKLKSFSHAELNVPQYTDIENIERRMKNLTDLLDRSTFSLEEVDDTWPEAVKNNRERWEKYIWKR
jgi:beta-1,4-mannosyl-glycoprotein beta-1,4-N-acetylglucosaminyltransferase